jgi:rod shape determining protein RodA
MSRWSLVGYWIMIVLLVAVLINTPLTTMRGGARRWFDLKVFLFQPSEFAKLAFIFAFGNYLSRPKEELHAPSIFFKALGMIALPFLLILKEPDLGSALIFIPTGLMMMLVAGVPRRFLLRTIGIVGVLAALFLVDILFAPPGWWTIKLEDYQRHRLLVYFGKDFAPENASPEEKTRARKLQQDKSYQGRQALISVGTGGFTGKGWCRGNQTSLGFLPPGAAHTDFIFSVIAEEKGFMGSVIVIALYSVVLFTGIRIAGQARDRLGKLLAVGVVTMFFSHIFINIGMNIRLMPVTGVPLPLLSYGGSSVLCSLIAMGILQNVNLYRRSY